MATARTGTGTTLTFQSGFTAKFIDNVEPFSEEVGDIDANTMETGDYAESIPEDFINLGEMTGTIEYDPEAEPPALREIDTLTIDPKGLGAGSLIRGSGYFKKFTPGIPVNGKMTADIAWKWNGGSFETNAS